MRIVSDSPFDFCVCLWTEHADGLSSFAPDPCVWYLESTRAGRWAEPLSELSRPLSFISLLRRLAHFSAADATNHYPTTNATRGQEDLVLREY